MAAVRVESGLSTGLDDSIFSLLDYSWYSQSILSHSKVRVPFMETTGTSPKAEQSAARSGVESEIIPQRRFSGADCPCGSASCLEECSSSQSVDGHIHPTDNARKEHHYSVDESEMKIVFNRFDENADGFISGEELRRYMSYWGINMSDDEAKSMIMSVDQNGDDELDFEEFFSLYQTFCPAGTAEDDDEEAREDEDDLLEAFRVFDKNQDGFISVQELQAVLLDLGMPEGKNLMMCQNMIRNVDQDGNGQCDLQEFQTMMFAQAL